MRLFHPTFWHEDHIEIKKHFTLCWALEPKIQVWSFGRTIKLCSVITSTSQSHWHDLLATFVFWSLGTRCRCIESLVWHGSLVRRKNHPSYPSSSLTFFRAWNAFSLGWDQQTMWNLFWTTQVWSKSIKWSYVISKMKIIKYILASTIFELSFKEVARL